MGAAYSKNLRERVLGCMEEGHTRQAAADLFKVSVRSIYQWQRLKRVGQSLVAKARASKPRKLDHERLRDYFRGNPGASLKECGAHFQVSHVSVFHT